MVQAGFFVLSLLAIFSALMVIFSRNPVHSVLYLVITFFAITGHYAMLNAQFLAVVNFIVYAGAIMVLFLFVVMLLNLNAAIEPHKKTVVKFAAVVTGGIFLVVIAAAIGQASIPETTVFNGTIGEVKNLGKVLFTDFLLPFEISSILFLSAMVGAVMLGKKQMQ